MRSDPGGSFTEYLLPELSVVTTTELLPGPFGSSGLVGFASGYLRASQRIERHFWLAQRRGSVPEWESQTWPHIWQGQILRLPTESFCSPSGIVCVVMTGASILKEKQHCQAQNQQLAAVAFSSFSTEANSPLFMRPKPSSSARSPAAPILRRYP
jgi:hypothetical protein